MSNCLLDGINMGKKAIVVGGSNGIGLAITKKLMDQNYHVFILDMVEPDISSLDITEYTYYPCNLLDFDDALFQKMSSDPDVDVLMITAGFGRVANFEYLHTAEIQNLINVNTVAGIKIIRYFYDKISSKETFYCGMMGSIAGLMSSPLFSVYAASKAAICRFIESINIELEAKETENRILNVSPASISGTKFNGGSNELSVIEELAEQIIEKLFSSEELFIPQYEETFRGVLERYQKDPHEYGLHSYQYKMQSGRVFNEKRVRIGYLSGTFDLFHVGHLNLLRRAKHQCDYLIVGVHPNAVHKGKETFIPFEERKEIVAGCKYVDRVVQSCPEDCDAWDIYHYHRLFVGSDYKGTERFNRYEEFFMDKDCEIIYFPYTQGTSSTQIRKTILMKSERGV